MSRPILSRPRTRVYGCNYDKGESYYKPTIENLDRKYSGRPLFAEPRNSFADEIAARRSDIGTRDLAGSRQGTFGRGDIDIDYEPPSSSYRRQQQQQAPADPFFDDEETVFDIRGQRHSRPRRQLGDDFANEVAATTSRLKSRLNMTSEILDDGLLDDRRQRGACSTLDEAESSSFRRRARFDDKVNDIIDDFNKPSLTKWSKLSDQADSIAEDFTSAAASRAKMSKARLNDLEQEMEEMAEKQARREKRTAALRALINETASEADDCLSSATKISQSSVHKSEKSEKHVTF